MSRQALTKSTSTTPLDDEVSFHNSLLPTFQFPVQYDASTASGAGAGAGQGMILNYHQISSPSDFPTIGDTEQLAVQSSSSENFKKKKINPDKTPEERKRNDTAFRLQRVWDTGAQRRTTLLLLLHRMQILNPHVSLGWSSDCVFIAIVTTVHVALLLSRNSMPPRISPALLSLL